MRDNLMEHSVKKILFISCSPFIGGAEVSLCSIITSLPSSLYQCFVAVPCGSPLNEQILPVAKFIEVPLILSRKHTSFIGMGTALLSVISTIRQLEKQVDQQGIDLIVANSTKSCIYGLFLKVFSGKKLFWFVRDNIESQFLCKIMGHCSSKIIFSSTYVANQLSGFQLKKVVIPNFINEKEVDLIKNQSRASEAVSNKVIIANIGQLVPWKNHFDAIMAFGQLSKIHEHCELFLFGSEVADIDGTYKRELEKYIERAGLQNKITFMGFKEDLLMHLDSADILLHTAMTEPFGRVIIEAMALGKPVVAYKAGGAAEIVTDYETGFLVDPTERFMGLTRKLKLLVENKYLRKKMGMEGEKICKKRYTSLVNIPLIHRALFCK